jgi:hypothetical protein
MENGGRKIPAPKSQKIKKKEEKDEEKIFDGVCDVVCVVIGMYGIQPI